MNSHHKSESQILKEESEIRLAQQDIENFGVLYDRYYKVIFVFVHRRTDDQQLTADIVSIVFMKAMMNLKTYKFKGLPFSSWLFRIAFNEVNMFFRKNKSLRIMNLNDSGLSNLAEETAPDVKERDKVLMAALAKLPEESVQLIEMRFFEDRPFAEIGVIMGITENNAKVKVYRILEKMKNLLKGRI